MPIKPLVLAAMLLVAPLVRAAEPAFRFAEATIDQLQASMAAGSLTSRELTQAYLDRIAQIDQAGPKLNAIIELNPDALTHAIMLDADRKAGRVRGPLHGIPILLKDNLDTADRMQTTAGSLALVGQKVPRDSFVAARLRDAGAVILGKTNMTEWANYRGNNSSSGWSARGGQTRNPYVLDRSPSGSSSGSAVAVAANLCVAAIGTETIGSIVSPSSACGIVGVKPTVGLVSRAGIIPIAASNDTAGPMTRTVRDAALVLAAITGTDGRDDATKALPEGIAGQIAAPFKPDALRGARIGVVRGPFGYHVRLDAVLNQLVETLRAAGAEIVDPVSIPSLSKLGSAPSTILSHEFKDGLNRYLGDPGRVTPVKSLAEAIAFNEGHRAEELLRFGQELFVNAQARGPLTDAAYQEALVNARRLTREDGVDAALAAHRLDALVMITRGAATPIDPLHGEASSGGSATLAAMAGYPSVTVPAAQVFELPVGLSFVGGAWSEAKLLALAADFEARSRARSEPRFRPTVSVP